MSSDSQDQAPDQDVVDSGDTAVATAPKLSLDVQITDSGPCKKKIKVAVSRDDIERQFNDSLKSMRREAQVPGFRPGRAPRTLVERRFRKEVETQVKSSLIMTSLQQLEDDYKINPITQPQLDIEAIALPDDGPMQYEMDVEVQPEFDTPDYKSLVLQRPTRPITDADVEEQLGRFLERYAQMVPKRMGGAEVGDFLVADLIFQKDGVTVNEAKEIQFRLQPELRFQDGHVADTDKLLVGVKANETREGKAQIGSSSADPALRGQTIDVTFVVKDLKNLRLPEVNAEFLDEIGFETEEELRDALKEMLQRRIEFQQRQALRKQVVDQLLEKVPFDLPAELVKRQERISLHRQVSEMKQAGYSDAEIRAREAGLRANAHETTLRSLREFFLLSKIAEAEGLKVEDDDVETEIEAIADRTDESPRRVRARIEKEGLGESLLTQILERKALQRVLEQVKIEDVAMEPEEKAAEAIDQSASGPNPDSEEGAAEGGSEG